MHDFAWHMNHSFSSDKCLRILYAYAQIERRAEKRKAAVEYIKTKDYYENASLVAKMFVPDPELPLSKRAWERLLCEWRHLLQRDVIENGPV